MYGSNSKTPTLPLLHNWSAWCDCGFWPSLNIRFGLNNMAMATMAMIHQQHLQQVLCHHCFRISDLLLMSQEGARHKHLLSLGKWDHLIGLSADWISGLLIHREQHLVRGNLSPNTKRFLCCNSHFHFLYIQVVSTFDLKSWKLFLAQYNRPDISLLHPRLHWVVFSPILSASFSKNQLTVLQKNALKKSRSLQLEKNFF